MRHARFWMAAPVLTLAATVIWASGCGTFGDECFSPGSQACKDRFDVTGSGGSTATSMNTGGEGGQPSSSNSGTGGMAPGCLPTDPTFVSDMCGVFVALAGKAGAAGTMTDPLPSLAAGIDAAVARNKYVFACADTFNERVTITNGIAIYGGREDCTKSWALQAGGATTVNGLVDTVALVIETPQHVTLENIDVMAPLATVTSKSSIAVQVRLAEAEFKNCKFTSQDAFKGEDGAMVPYDPALDGTAGSPGKAVCAAGNHPGAVASVKTCGSATSTGGKGGDGAAPTAMSGGNGADGTVSSAGGTGFHGNGQTSAATCTSGGQGSSGSIGADGAGATGIGSISASGYVGASGGAGGTGTPGIGGGGGGGSKGVTASSMVCGNSDPTDYYGASGGSGGSGGCGGKPGNVGGPGGSSIVLMVVNAKSVKLDTVTLTPGQGGNGGTGGPGQAGGSQGPAGLGGDSVNGGGLKVGCAGGAGGNGGRGGPGGGGQGGHSLGVAFKGTAPMGAPIFPQTMPKPGAGGDAGAGAKDPKVGKGVAGNSTDPASYTLEFK